MENIPKIMSSSSSKTNAVLAAVQKSLQSRFTEAHSSTSAAENTLTYLQNVTLLNYNHGGDKMQPANSRKCQLTYVRWIPPFLH